MYQRNKSSTSFPGEAMYYLPANVVSQSRIKLLLIRLAAVLLLTQATAQNTVITGKTYSAGQLVSDLKILRAALEEGHPGIYRYQSKTKMDSIFCSTEASITGPMSEREFRIFISKLTGRIGCGHTKVVAPKPDQSALDNGPTAFPFQTYYSDGELYILRNFSTFPDQEFLGAKVVSINDHPADSILSDMFAIFSSDGNNMTHKYRSLTSPRNFTRYFNYLYGYQESYSIEYITKQDTSPKITIFQGMKFDELISIRKIKYAATYSASPLELRLLDDKISAYLKIESFDQKYLKQHKINFARSLRKHFKKINKNHIHNLILDLRHNGGGSDEFGKLLFSYFIDHEFYYYSSLTMNKQRYEFFKYTTRPDASAPKNMLKRNSTGTFDNVKSPNVGIQAPSHPFYSGKIYVLINGGCFSTTCEVLSMLHAYTKAVFIGEEAGGGYYGNNSGPTPDLILPNTMIRVEIPLMKYEMAVRDYEFKDRGLIPDYEIIPSIDDKLSGTDAELKFALRLIYNE